MERNNTGWLSLKNQTRYVYIEILYSSALFGLDIPLLLRKPRNSHAFLVVLHACNLYKLVCGGAPL